VGLADLLAPWNGSAYRHITSRAEANVLDFRFAGTGADNRWNEPGLPTLYLAGDERVAVAEWGRHLTMQRNSALAPLVQERRLFRLGIALDHVLELRRVETWNALSLTDTPHCFLDVEVARATALFIRRTTSAQAIIVPSVAFLDDLDHWILVAFLEKCAADQSWIVRIEPCGALNFG
jgi:RES domain-containing protein